MVCSTGRGKGGRHDRSRRSRRRNGYNGRWSEALLFLGRGVLILTGWEVAVAVVAIQFLIWYFSDAELQTWLEKCAFGRKPANPAWNAGKQSDEFETALKVMGL